MGFQNVADRGSASKIMKATDIPVGESITGHVVRFEDSHQYEGQKNIVLRISGEDTLLFTAGNLRYMITDGKIKVGQLTRITALGEEKKRNKAGKSFTQTQFTVEQDPEDTLDDVSFAQISNVPTKEDAPKLSSAKPVLPKAVGR